MGRASDLLQERSLAKKTAGLQRGEDLNSGENHQPATQEKHLIAGLSVFNDALSRASDHLNQGASQIFSTGLALAPNMGTVRMRRMLLYISISRWSGGGSSSVPKGPVPWWPLSKSYRKRRRPRFAKIGNVAVVHKVRELVHLFSLSLFEGADFHQEGRDVTDDETVHAHPKISMTMVKRWPMLVS